MNENQEVTTQEIIPQEQPALPVNSFYRFIVKADASALGGGITLETIYGLAPSIMEAYSWVEKLFQSTDQRVKLEIKTVTEFHSGSLFLPHGNVVEACPPDKPAKLIQFIPPTNLII